MNEIDQSQPPSSHASQRVLRYLIPALVLAALGALAVVGYLARGTLEPEIALTLQPDAACDLRQAACELALPDGGKVSFNIGPRSIPLLEPLALTVVVSDALVTAVEVDFVGVDMNMGYNHARLVAQDDGAFRGSATLPVCVRQRMDWEARVLLETASGWILAPFHFHTLKGRGA
ncbi:MAG: hypothetical protein ACFCUJ_12845 [Thiotrichales bacterium]